MNWESTEQATTSVLMARNSCTRSLNAMISVGQTNVLQKEKNNNKQTLLRKNILCQSTTPATQRKRLCNMCLRCYSQVQGIEEEDEIFAFVVGQLQLLEFTVNDGGSFPVWCRLWNLRQKNNILMQNAGSRYLYYAVTVIWKHDVLCCCKCLNVTWNSAKIKKDPCALVVKWHTVLSDQWPHSPKI